MYSHENERVKIAKSDPMCKGFVYWPELSHGDNFQLEYIAKNAWDDNTVTIAEQIDNYCNDRYPTEISSKMTEIWHKFMPIVEECSWSPDSEMQVQIADTFTNVIKNTSFKKQFTKDYKVKVDRIFRYIDNAVEILNELKTITATDEMTTRDLYDITRTVLSRFLNATIYQAQYLHSIDAPLNDIEKAFDSCKGLLNSLTDLLGLSADYSLKESFNRLKTVTYVNSNFETTLKNSAECEYCRSQIYENCKYLYIPEMEALFNEIKRCILSGEEYERKTLDTIKAEIKNNYFKTALSQMTATKTNFESVLENSISVLKNLNK